MKKATQDEGTATGRKEPAAKASGSKLLAEIVQELGKRCG